MRATTLEELRTWRLADTLRREIIAITSTPPANADRKFCNSFTDAIGSVCRLLAEGFGRYKPRDFGNYVRMALGSIAETQDHLKEARDKKYIDQKQFDRLFDLSEHIKACSKNLHKYLKHPATRAPE